MKLTLAYSPCPNDTFAFHAMVHNLVDTGEFEFDVTLADVEELNRSAQEGRFDICKVSYSAFFGFCDRYIMLRSGSALGFNNGPLLVHTGENIPSEEELAEFSIAIPGEHTTAALLLRSTFPQCRKLIPMLYSDIEKAVLDGRSDAGLLIHEGRFTYEKRGLRLIADMGKLWQDRFGVPVPLGGIAIKRELLNIAPKINEILRTSIEFAHAKPYESAEYIARNAQESDPEVQKSHIELYVNDFTRDIGTLGKRAVYTLFDKATDIYPEVKASANLFIY
jgi:1,4-dihydroxy-6-naphthoate synthase